MMTIQRLKTLVGNDVDAVNALIVERIQAESGLIDDLTNHIIQSGGKRLRPLMVLLASHACGYQGRHHITLATMIEFFHTATLLHDDVIDESTLRRGRETAHEIWGSKASILVGDYLFTQYMQLMIDVGDLNIIQTLTNIAHRITCGEIKQLSHRHHPSLTQDAYFEIIQSKTALLFSVSARLGALVSHAPSHIEDALASYGLHVGQAFQLVDDALDYTSDAQTLGKNIGDDLADGKATLPLLHALKHGTPHQQQCIRDSLSQGNRTAFPEILEAITATNAIEHTLNVAKQEVEHAITALACLPESVYKEALRDIAYYALHRDH